MKRGFDTKVRVPRELREKLIRMANLNGIAPEHFLSMGIRAQLDELESRNCSSQSADGEVGNV